MVAKRRQCLPTACAPSDVEIVEDLRLVKVHEQARSNAQADSCIRRLGIVGFRFRLLVTYTAEIDERGLGVVHQSWVFLP